MLSSYLTDALIRQQSTVEQLQTTDSVGAVATYSRLTSVSLTTAGTFINWNAVDREYQISKSGTEIYIPTDGWYLINLTAYIAPNGLLRANLWVNYVLSSIMPSFSNGMGGNTNGHSFITQRYFFEGDVVEIELIPSVNTSLTKRNEGSSYESPQLNIVQLSGPVEE